MADAVKAARQYMDQKTADELVGCKRHLLVSIAAFDAVVLPPEGDGLLVECLPRFPCMGLCQGGVSTGDTAAHLFSFVCFLCSI